MKIQALWVVGRIKQLKYVMTAYSEESLKQVLSIKYKEISQLSTVAINNISAQICDSLA